MQLGMNSGNMDVEAHDEDHLGHDEDHHGHAAYDTINVDSLEDFSLDPKVVQDVQTAWRTFLDSVAVREPPGEALYQAIMDNAPNLKSLFTTPKAVQAMRFRLMLHNMVMALADAARLRGLVETLGFSHLNLDVTVAGAAMFRDAIMDFFRLELGKRISNETLKAFKSFLNYACGAMIYVKAHYAERLSILSSSWQVVRDNGDDSNQLGGEGNTRSGESGSDLEAGEAEKANSKAESKVQRSRGNTMMQQNIPTTFKAMFRFNAAVMGFGSKLWMQEVLECFDRIVTNVTNSARLQEECDILLLRLSKVAEGSVNLTEFKSCMLASLRSLLVTEWTTGHEISWVWVWDIVEKLLLRNMGSPPKWEKALARLFDSIDEATGYALRKDIFVKFFVAEPKGEAYFKQSNTYLHLIASKALAMTLDIYRDPVRMVDDISALGLRHVGYAIPTDLIGPFSSILVEVVEGLATDTTAIESFQWSLGLVSKSLVRTILEGSTVVMRAINQNKTRSVLSAISCAPRGERVRWMLQIEVGSQSISPLLWSIQSGSMEAARTMLTDLLTIRADRDRYYYAADELFSRHQDILKILLEDAPDLVWVLLDGLVWRSSATMAGLRRVNFYVKYLMVDLDGEFHRSTEWLVMAADPKLSCHPIVVLLEDLLWRGLARRSFLLGKSWMFFTLCIFLISNNFDAAWRGSTKSDDARIIGGIFRILIYALSLGEMLFHHAAKVFSSCSKRQFAQLFGLVPVPHYLVSYQESISLILTCCLVVMLASEPIVHCSVKDTELFDDSCGEAARLRFFPCSVFSMIAMLLYFSLLVDLAVLNNRISAWLLMAVRMWHEVAMFLSAMCFTIVTASSALTCLDTNLGDLAGIGPAALAVSEMFLGLFIEDGWTEMHGHPVVTAGCLGFLVVTDIFLANLLIAQITSGYKAVYQDIVGLARLKRMRMSVNTMPVVPKARWRTYVESFKFDRPIEFNEGDVGVHGGYPTEEPSWANPTSVDRIRRFGGSTSVLMQWPHEDLEEDEISKFDRVETLLQRALSNLTKTRSAATSKTSEISSVSETALASTVSLEKDVQE